MREPGRAGDADLDEQIAYYRARAAEYDEWFLRTGRYDHGAEQNAQWFAEADEVRAALAAFAPAGRVLELAGGTGIWTEQLLRFASRVTVVDSAPEMLALNRARVGTARVEHIQADIFSWRPTTRYDVVFFSFWLSHVPPARFAAFWALVRDALAPRGRVFFIDSLYSESSSARDHERTGPQATTTRRRLNDGREFEIVKVFYAPEALAAHLAALGWQARVQATANYFLYGSATVTPGRESAPRAP